MRNTNDHVDDWLFFMPSIALSSGSSVTGDFSARRPGRGWTHRRDSNEGEVDEPGASAGKDVGKCGDNCGSPLVYERAPHIQ